MKKNNQKPNQFYTVPQTDEETEYYRKIIQEMRKKGLLQKYEKTFRIDKDGNILENQPDPNKPLP